MRNSPFQLLESFFQKVSIEPKSSEALPKDESLFDKMDLQFFDQIERLPDYWDEGRSPNEAASKHTYQVTLGVRTVEDSSSGVYAFELIASGVVACMKEDSKWTRPTEMLVHEYGKALLFGMIREQLANTTARMVPGVRLLPTVNFLGSAPVRESETSGRETAPSSGAAPEVPST